MQSEPEESPHLPRADCFSEEHYVSIYPASDLQSMLLGMGTFSFAAIISFGDVASYALMFLAHHMPISAQPSLNLVQLSQQLYIERSRSSSYANGFRMFSL